MAESDKGLVLVPGCTGFLGGWIAMKALEAGYRVRGTTRNLEGKRTNALLEKCPGLEIVKAELLSDDGWDEAFEGVKFLIHSASPFFMDAGKDFDFIAPAVEGTKHILNKAKKFGLEAVVVTSTMGAVSYGHTCDGTQFTEEHWSIVKDGDKSYAASKTYAERAVWEWSKENHEIRVNTVNPGFIIGPPLNGGSGGTLEIMKKFSGQKMGPATTQSWSDVRDVAEVHVSLLDPKNHRDSGHRHLACKVYYLFDIMPPVVEEFNPLKYQFPEKPVPRSLVCCLDYCCCCCNPLKSVRRWMYVDYSTDHASSEKLTFAGKFRDPSQGFIEMAHVMIQEGHLGDITPEYQAWWDKKKSTSGIA